MSSKPENQFIASVHRHLPADLYRMKNHNQYNAGIADVWYSGGKDLWIEYKFVVLPKRSDTIVRIDLSALQRDWLKSRHAEGRTVKVVVGHKGGGVWFDHPREWEVNPTAESFLQRSVTRGELADMILRTVYP